MQITRPNLAYLYWFYQYYFTIQMIHTYMYKQKQMQEI